MNYVSITQIFFSFSHNSSSSSSFLPSSFFLQGGWKLAWRYRGGEEDGQKEEKDKEEEVMLSCRVVKGGRQRAPSSSLRVVFDVWPQNGIFDELLKCRRRFNFCD